MRVLTMAQRIAATVTAMTAFALLLAQPALAADSQPAKGASVTDLAWGAGVGGLLTALLLVVGIRHRAGKTRLLTRLADFAERVSGLPGWCALPSAIAGGSALIAVFGFYWDVAKHIDTGRDPSPFGTPAHYPILVGLAGLALGRLLAGRRLRHALQELAGVVLEQLDVQLLLGGEVLVDQGFGDARRPGDVVDGGGVVAALGEELDGRAHDALAPLLGRQAFPRDGTGTHLVCGGAGISVTCFTDR